MMHVQGPASQPQASCIHTTDFAVPLSPEVDALPGTQGNDPRAAATAGAPTNAGKGVFKTAHCWVGLGQILIIDAPDDAFSTGRHAWVITNGAVKLTSRAFRQVAEF